MKKLVIACAVAAAVLAAPFIGMALHEAHLVRRANQGDEEAIDKLQEMGL